MTENKTNGKNIADKVAELKRMTIEERRAELEKMSQSEQEEYLFNEIMRTNGPILSSIYYNYYRDEIMDLQYLQCIKNIHSITNEWYPNIPQQVKENAVMKVLINIKDGELYAAAVAYGMIQYDKNQHKAQLLNYLSETKSLITLEELKQLLPQKQYDEIKTAVEPWIDVLSDEHSRYKNHNPTFQISRTENGGFQVETAQSMKNKCDIKSEIDVNSLQLRAVARVAHTASEAHIASFLNDFYKDWKLIETLEKISRKTALLSRVNEDKIKDMAISYKKHSERNLGSQTHLLECVEKKIANLSLQQERLEQLMRNRNEYGIELKFDMLIPQDDDFKWQWKELSPYKINFDECYAPTLKVEITPQNRNAIDPLSDNPHFALYGTSMEYIIHPFEETEPLKCYRILPEMETSMKQGLYGKAAGGLHQIKWAEELVETPFEEVINTIENYKKELQERKEFILQKVEHIKKELANIPQNLEDNTNEEAKGSDTVDTPIIEDDRCY